MVSFLRTILLFSTVCKPFQVVAGHVSDRDDYGSCGIVEGTTEIITVDYYKIFPVYISQYFATNTVINVPNYGSISITGAPKTFITTVTATEKVPTTITAVIAASSSSVSTDTLHPLTFTPIVLEVQPLKSHGSQPIYIDQNGSTTLFCSNATSFVLNGTHLQTSEGLMSTNNGSISSAFAATSQQGSITETFSLSEEGLSWENAAFPFGHAKFFLTSQGVVEAVFSPFFNTTNLLPVRLVPVPAYACSGTTKSQAASVYTTTYAQGALSNGPPAGQRTETSGVTGSSSSVAYQIPTSAALYGSTMTTLATVSRTTSISNEVSSVVVDSSTSELPVQYSSSSMAYYNTSSASTASLYLGTTSSAKPSNFSTTTAAMLSTSSSSSALGATNTISLFGSNSTSAVKTLATAATNSSISVDPTTHSFASTTAINSSTTSSSSTITPAPETISTTSSSFASSSSTTVGFCQDDVASYFSSGSYSSYISSFCYGYIGTSTTASATTTTAETTTETVTPEVVTIDEITTATAYSYSTKTFYTSTYTGGANNAKRAEATSIPEYLSEYSSEEVSSACSCVFGVMTIATTEVATVTESSTTTTTEEANSTTNLSTATAAATHVTEVDYVSDAQLTCDNTHRGGGGSDTHAVPVSYQTTIYECAAVCMALSNCASIQYNYATTSCVPRTISIAGGAITVASATSAFYFYDILCFE